MKARILTGVIFASLLTGCVSRDRADDRLVRGCVAGVEVLMPENYTLKNITNRDFGNAPDAGDDFRQVTLDFTESDGWASADKQAVCVFEESFPLFGLRHVASLYQLKINGEIYGRQGDKILGSLEDHLKLTEAVQQAMGQ